MRAEVDAIRGVPGSKGRRQGGNVPVAPSPLRQLARPLRAHQRPVRNEAVRMQSVRFDAASTTSSSVRFQRSTVRREMMRRVEV